MSIGVGLALLANSICLIQKTFKRRPEVIETMFRKILRKWRYI